MFVLRAIWSLVAWPLAFLLMALAFLASVPPWIFLRFERFQQYTAAPILWPVLYCTLSRVTFLFDPRYDVKRTSVYTANHTSMLDAHACIGAIRRPFCGLENAAHFLIPFYGWLMRAANGIPVPKGEGRTEAIVAAARNRAERDIAILTFPEGHRTPDGAVHTFKRGAFVMARDAGMPVVPIAIRGMYKCLPKGTWVVTPSHIQIFTGPQFETEGLTDDELLELAEHVRTVVEDWVHRGVLPDTSKPTWRPERLRAASA